MKGKCWGYRFAGCRKTEVARALFGADKIISGEIYINNIKTKINKPIKAMGKDIALLPEDRKASGLHQGLNIRTMSALLICINST